MKKRLLSIALVLCMVLSIFTGTAVASEADSTYSELATEDAEYPLYTGSNELIAKQLKTGPLSFSGCSTRTLNDDEVLRRGIDVSQWQGTIDWESVKSSGVEFAFVRVAYRGLSTGELYPDSAWKQNIEGALANGIQVGAYIFSQATDETMARQEAVYAANLIKEYSITLPLVMDFEFGSYNDSSGASQPGILEKAFIDGALSKEDKAKTTAICNAFCDEAEELGYTGMVYASKDMLTNYLNAESLSNVWLSDFGTSTSYTGDYTFWQFSDCGSIDGISGNVDLDFWFDRKSVAESCDHNWSEAVSVTEPVTRGQFAYALWILLDCPEPSIHGFIEDVPEDSPYRKAIYWVWEHGITTGTTTTTFSPDDTCAERRSSPSYGVRQENRN